MLKEINCEFFTEKKIEFKEGLNVILGDDSSTNSIGKSTLLMIIDFVFGGESYLEKNSGSIKALGDHSFSYSFLFKNESYYFKRETKTPGIIYRCDNLYNSIEIIESKKYTEFLAVNYINNIDRLSFRETVSLYSRVWGKENLNVDKPLQSFLREPESESIKNLIKLFNRYNEISELIHKINENNESKKILKGAVKKDYINNITKSDYKQNEIKIDQAKKQIDEIKDGLLKFTLNLNELKNREILDLKEQKNKLLIGQNVIQNKIRRIEINLEDKKSIKPKHLSLLTNFFPNSNIERINEIESFHLKISEILKKQLMEAKKRLENELSEYSFPLAEINEKIDKILSGVESPKYIIDRVLDITLDTNKLEIANKFYDEKITIDKNLVEFKGKLDETFSLIINDIQLKINNQLLLIHKEIFGENRRAPEISLREKAYTFDHFNNTGTGKTFIDLIIFDLAILNLTEVPFLIHDSPLFKNIEDFSIDKIVLKYNDCKKQIFISIDGINRYNDVTQEILVKKQVIGLNNQKLLFVKDWRSN
ncbi:MAG TPA: DUF2326 domain-containing protein [Bacteroidia bacterium]|jgi:hypothetical protein|nr:DUF2326 domain-containing protein [Bacteroidia bacterium]